MTPLSVSSGAFGTSLIRRIDNRARIDNLAELCCFLDEPIFKADSLFNAVTTAA